MNKKLCKCSGSWARSFLIKSALPFAISIPVFVSSSCGMFYRTYNERELSIYLNTDILESKIRKIIDNRIQVFRLGYKWVLRYSPEVKEKIGEFLKLISSFTYAPNYEFPGIENEYISYLYYTGENKKLFYSNEIEESKIAKEYDSKNVHKALTLDNLFYFDGIKYAKELS
ncbi:Mbov_0186 family lipoprotein, partial [Mycoplasmopsis bovis]